MKANSDIAKNVSKSDISATSDFNELITVIVDYYCFKGDFAKNNEEDGDEGEEWKKGIENEDQFSVPPKIDKLIEIAFIKQLEKYTK